MRMLNSAPLEVIHGFEWSYQYRTPDKEFLLLSRKSREAEFIVLYEPYLEKSKLSQYERLTVLDENGKTVMGAIGLLITLAGKPYEIIFNPDGNMVKTVKGFTRRVMSIEIDRKRND